MVLWWMVDDTGAIVGRWTYDRATLCPRGPEACASAPVPHVEGPTWRIGGALIAWTSPDTGSLTVGDASVAFRVWAEDAAPSPVQPGGAPFSAGAWRWDGARLSVGGHSVYGYWTTALDGCRADRPVRLFHPVAASPRIAQGFLIVGADGIPHVARDVRRCDPSPACPRTPAASTGVVLDDLEAACL